MDQVNGNSCINQMSKSNNNEMKQHNTQMI